MDNEVASSNQVPDGKSRVLPLVPIVAVLAALVLVIAFAVGADWTDEDTLSAAQGLPDLRQELSAHSWLLDPAASTVIGDPEPITLTFHHDSVSGVGPCNAYMGELSVDDADDTIAITELRQTGRACDPIRTRTEDEYLAALSAVRDVDLSDGYSQERLELSNDDGDVLAFTAIDYQELAPGRWSVVNVATDGALESVIEGTEPTLDLESGGSISIDTGCNTVRGDFAIEGDRLTTDSLARTAMECAEPNGVMGQEAALVRALETAQRVSIIPDQLTIIDASGDIVLVAIDRTPSE